MRDTRVRGVAAMCGDTHSWTRYTHLASVNRTGEVLPLESVLSQIRCQVDMDINTVYSTADAAPTNFCER
jgi:hypothetical protein